jgi:flagellin
MVINTNTSALTSSRLLSDASNMLSKSLSRLSSGSKIISPEDDAAGLAVATRIDSQVSRIKAAKSNLGNAISFNQTQDGFLQKVSKAMDRMGELAVLAQDITKTDTDRGLYDTEFQKLASYINDLASKDFNGVTLFDGAALDVTTDSDGNVVSTTGVDGTAYDLTADDLTSSANAATALGNIKTAIDAVASDRANVGANISVLSSYNDQLSVLKDTLLQANSRIKDVDVAEESSAFAKYNILVQAGTAMLAQANQTPQSVLKLIG